ncbi:hypothetical protein Trydic_g2219 [Trypoxylus dichotomus]
MSSKDNLQKLTAMHQIALKEFQKCRKTLCDLNTRIREQQIEINKLRISKFSLTNEIEMTKQRVSSLEKEYKIILVKPNHNRKTEKKLDLALLKIGDRVRKFHRYIHKTEPIASPVENKVVKLATLTEQKHVLLQQIFENKKRIDEIMAKKKPLAN